MRNLASKYMCMKIWLLGDLILLILAEAVHNESKHLTKAVYQPIIAGTDTDQSEFQFRNAIITPIPAEFGQKYTKSVNGDQGYLFEYHYSHVNDSVVHLTTTLTNIDRNDSNKFPTQVVVRQQSAIQSWNLPLEMQHEVQFSSVSRKLCAIGQELNTVLPITAEVTTFADVPIEFSIYAELQTNLTVSIGHKYSITITPSSPQYYQYTFDESRGFRSVTLYINSSEDYSCSLVAIQDAECPIEDLQSTISTGVTFQTFLKSAAIIIDKKPKSKSVYIVFSVSPSDISCAGIDRIIPLGEMKTKTFDFWIEGHIEDTVYIFAVLAALGYCSLYCGCALLYIGILKLWSRVRVNQELELNVSDELQDTSGNVNNTPGSTSSHDPSTDYDDSLLIDTDVLEEQNEDKDIYRSKKNLMVSDMARKGPAQLRKKYGLYIRNLITISIFYALPVVQLVLTYQKYLNLSGNEDICYYNFLCSRKLGVFHSFNNVFSNIGYMVLGILFIIIICFRYRDTRSIPEDQRELFGIPQHFGIFYAMGLALFVEGIMSGSYHVCPSYNNFQFDTAFMYILGGLLMLRLFQSRHADINANAHTAYLSLAIIIIVAVIGVLFNAPAFWDVFTVVYLLCILYLSLQIYYVGRFRIDRTLITDLKYFISSTRSNGRRCAAPMYPVKFGLMLFMNACNWGLGLYGAIERPADFASFMLYIMIMNLTIYSGYYVIMKRFIFKEKIVPQAIIFGIISMVLWGFALWYFTHNLTDWQKTPAKSRNLNAPCLILDFFDGHDVWHFFSAGAMFCAFLAVLFVDDDLKKVPREKIPAF